MGKKTPPGAVMAVDLAALLKVVFRIHSLLNVKLYRVLNEFAVNEICFHFPSAVSPVAQWIKERPTSN